MYFGDMVDVFLAREIGLVDEVVGEDLLMDRAKELIARWIDTPGRPFCKIKEMLRKDTVQQIRRKLSEEPWEEDLGNFFRDDVRQTLELVQASMQ
jgi:enoyl-CoA hydratase/carnithine racemase